MTKQLSITIPDYIFEKCISHYKGKNKSEYIGGLIYCNLVIVGLLLSEFHDCLLMEDTKVDSVSQVERHSLKITSRGIQVRVSTFFRVLCQSSFNFCFYLTHGVSLKDILVKCGIFLGLNIDLTRLAFVDYLVLLVIWLLVNPRLIRSHSNESKQRTRKSTRVTERIGQRA
jgi:hypothetical protein